MLQVVRIPLIKVVDPVKLFYLLYTTKDQESIIEIDEDDYTIQGVKLFVENI